VSLLGHLHSIVEVEEAKGQHEISSDPPSQYDCVAPGPELANTFVVANLGGGGVGSHMHYGGALQPLQWPFGWVVVEVEVAGDAQEGQGVPLASCGMVDTVETIFSSLEPVQCQLPECVPM